MISREISNFYPDLVDQIPIDAFHISANEIRPIERPPDALIYFTSTFGKGMNIVNSDPGNYVASVSIQDQRNDQSVINSSELMPEAIRYLHGYQQEQYPSRNCHSMAISFNFPAFDDLMGYIDLVELVNTRYTRLSGPQELHFGDHIRLVIGIGKSKEKPIIWLHSMIYVDDGLVFSKNGGGPTVPFYLQDVDQVVRSYNDGIISHLLDTEYWRPPISLDL